MRTIRVRKGIALSLRGKPKQCIDAGPVIKTVSWQVPGSRAVKPQQPVKVGQQVRCGEALFTDAFAPSIMHTAPASGIIENIVFGDKRDIRSIEIRCNNAPAVFFDIPKKPYSTDCIRILLQQSGLWNQIRERPFDVTPAADSIPAAIFITAMDTRPLAPDPAVIIAERRNEFVAGIEALAGQTNGKVFVSQASASAIAPLQVERTEQNVFVGRHPAGLAGTHIQYLHPVTPQSHVWHIEYQDVIAIGSLLQTGQLSTERIIALAGTPLREPRLIRTQAGASIADVLDSQLLESQHRVSTISGSVFAGRQPRFLGRFDSQLLLFPAPALSREMSVESANDLDINSDSSERTGLKAFVAEPRFETVSPLQLLPVPLLRALLVRDLTSAQALGCLELAEEDLEPHAYVCPAGNNYPAALRACLHDIQSMAI